MFTLAQIPATIVALANLSTKTDLAKKILIDLAAYMEVPYVYLAKLTFQKIAENPLSLIERLQILRHIKVLDLTELINDVTMIIFDYIKSQPIGKTKQTMSFKKFKDVESNRYEQDEMPNDILFLQAYLNHFTNN